MTRRELVDYCLTFSGAYEDYPFHDPNWTLMRHGTNRRAFAMIYERGGRLWANLKCEPMQGEFWRKIHPQVTPGYHVNKTHWVTVPLDGSLDPEVLREMVGHSYEQIRPRVKKRPPPEK